MKKSFLLHYDSLSVIDKMTDGQVGKLLRKMKSYHNWNDYDPEDIVVEIAFEQFKNQFDRDIKKYINVCERNVENWKKWWRPPNNPKNPSGLSGNPKEPKKADNDNDNESDNDNKNKKQRKTAAAISTYEEFVLKLEWVDRASEYPKRNIEIEKQRCRNKLEWKIKNAKSTFRNRLLPKKREPEYSEWLVDKTDEQWITEFLAWKTKFHDKYWRDKYQEVKDKRIQKCLSQPLSL